MKNLTVDRLFKTHTNGRDAKTIVITIVSGRDREYPSDLHCDSGFDFTIMMDPLGNQLKKEHAPTLTDAYQLFCTNNIDRNSFIEIYYDGESIHAKDVKFNTETNEIELYI